jgi:hypothetical protein
MASSSAPPMVDYSEFDASHVSNLSPREKEWKNETGSGKYKELPLMYDYSTPDHKKTDKPYIQYPEMKIPRGIQEKMSQSGGYNEYSVMIVFDMSNPEHVKTVDGLNSLHKRIANLIAPVKGTLGLHHFNPDTPEASGLAQMIYVARDKITGEVLEGKDPTQFYKMYKNTVFADLTGKAIDHNILKDAEITGYPLVCHTHVYIGTKITIKSHIQSFIVTGVKKADGLARQVSTIGRVLEQNPNAQSSLEAQIAALMGDNQDVLIQREQQVQAPAIVEQQVPVQTAQVQAPQVPAIVEQQVPVAQVPTAQVQSPQVPAIVEQQVPVAQVPTTQVQAPQVPTAQVQAPQVPTAQVQVPAPDLQAYLAQSAVQPQLSLE